MMLRKCLLISVLSVCTALGAFGKNPSGEIDAFDADNNYMRYGMYRVMRGEPIKYSYTVVPSSGTVPNSSKPSGKLQADIAGSVSGAARDKIITQNLQAWPFQTVKFIRAAGRETEFADLIALFSNVKVEKASAETEADVQVSFSDMPYIRAKVRDDTSCGMAMDSTVPISIFVLDPTLDVSNSSDACFRPKENAYEFSDVVLLHELGHFYGLADQYDTSNASPLFSDTGRLGRKSIMGSSFEKTLQCDDVDGFIKLADRVFYKMHGKYTARDSKGWKSLCNDGKTYRYGKELNRKPYFSHWDLYKYTPSGDIAEVLPKRPYMEAETASAQRNADGLIEKVTDSESGVYFKYIYRWEEGPVIQVCAYRISDDLLLECANYTKDIRGNYWNVDGHRLFISDEVCHLTREAVSVVNMYVNKKDGTLTWDFSYDGQSNNRLLIRKYDFSGEDYTCEYRSNKKTGASSSARDYKFVVRYESTKKAFTTLDHTEGVSLSVTSEAMMHKICSLEPDYFFAPPMQAWPAACNFFSAVDAYFNKLIRDALRAELASAEPQR